LAGPGIVDALSRQKEERPARTAIVDPIRGKQLNYRELYQAVDRTARRLRTAGVEPGQRVGVLVESRLEWIISVLALLARPATAALLDSREPHSRLSEIVESLGLSTLVCDSSTESTAGKIESADTLLSTNNPSNPETTFIDQVKTGPSLKQSPEPADDAVVMFTSGSTGRPKPVQLTHRNLSAHAQISNEFFNLSDEDSWLAPLPLCHMGGFGPVVRTIRAGGELILQSYEFPDMLDVLRAYDVTMMSLVPTQVKRLMKHPSVFPPASLRVLLVGGARVPVSLKKRCLDRDVPIHTSYGLTETTSHVAVAKPGDIRESPRDVPAQVLPGIDVQIDPPSTTETNESSGEIIVEGDVVSPGYVRPDGDRPESKTRSNRIRSGDRGRLDDGGRLHVEGRLDTVITSGGESIHPEAVASVIRTHEDVEAVAVVGLEDDKWGEALGAVVASTNGELSPEALETFCENRLAPFKIPKHWLIDEDLPRTDSGSVDRRAVKNRLRNSIS
jgi:O-succinylbenzoic acid--CoA ligase